MLSAFVLLQLLAGLSFADSPAADSPAAESCAVVAPDYYRIDLVPTRRVPGAARAVGYADVAFNESPFVVSVSAAGHYVYDLQVVVEDLPTIPGKEYVVWVAPPDLQEVTRVGPLVEGRAATKVTLNKYLVILTLEAAGAAADSWSGPVVMRGMSRSGMMHTMAGHGPFEGEPCAVFGF